MSRETTPNPGAILEADQTPLSHVPESRGVRSLRSAEKAVLLPCPFCGGRCSVEDQKPFENITTWITICCQCYMMGRSYAVKKEAIDAWNTRTTPPARSYADGVEFEEAAKIADAFASGQQQMIDEEGPDEACRGGKEVAEFIANAIRRRAAIRLLSQGGKA